MAAKKKVDGARSTRIQQVSTLKGILLLLACGGIFGLAVPLSKIAVEIEANPIGLAFWVNLFAMLFCVPFVLEKRNLPKLNWPLIKFFCIWGFVSAGAGEILIFWVAEVLPASIISIIIVTEGFIVFLVAALFRIEEPNVRRFLGVAIGLAGIVAIIIATEGLVGSSAWIWIVVALGIPLGYAIEDVIIAAKMPEDVDTLTAVAYVCLSASVMLLIAAILLDDFVMLSLNPGKLELSIALIGVTGSLGTFLFVRLIKTTGAVFASQCGYVMTFSGIAWSIILLGETLSVLTWAALAVIVVGLVIVGPQEEPEPALEPAGLPAK